MFPIFHHVSDLPLCAIFPDAAAFERAGRGQKFWLSALKI
jgi:hypothetical protein